MPVDYSLEQQIGRGSFGVVYRGLKISTCKRVAIKVLDMDTEEEE